MQKQLDGNRAAKLLTRITMGAAALAFPGTVHAATTVVTYPGPAGIPASDQFGGARPGWDPRTSVATQGQVGQWKLIEIPIGQWCANRVVRQVLLGFDQPGSKGLFKAVVDDVSIGQE